MTSFLRRSALLTALVLVLTSPVLAQVSRPKFRFVPAPKAGGGEVRWSVAEHGHVEFERGEYALFEGDVRIEYQDLKLAADRITWNQRTNDVVAEGHVVIDQGPTRMTAAHAVYNLDTKTGTFFNATATMEPTMYFSGDRVEKMDEDTYRLTNGVLTSCDLDKPAWSFHVGQADITLDDYAHMRDIAFRARGIPVFWTPRLVWPTKKDRSAGFLIPRINLTSTFGQRMELAYYVPYGDSADATIMADVSTKEYFGAGINVRYRPSEDVKVGELTAHAVNNVGTHLPLEPGQKPEQQVEWKYKYQHVQDNLPGGFRGVVDTQDFSDIEFFRLYDRDPQLHTLSNLYSSAYLTKNRPGYSLNILSDRRDLLFANARQRYEQLPSVQFRMYPQRVLGSPLYFSLESSTSHLRTSGISSSGVYSRGADYFRTDVFPTFSMQLRTAPWFSVKPQVSMRQTFYSASLGTDGKPDESESLSRFYAQGQVELVGPSFSRVFNRSVGNFSKFKHVIEPRFRYVLTTDVNDQERVIRFDTVDTPFLPIVRDTVEYALVQRLIGKESGEAGNAREIVSFSLRQSVALSDPFTQSSGGTHTTPLYGQHKFTPLTASLHVNPYQSLTLDVNSMFGNISHQLDQVSVSANYVGTGRMADKYLGLTWFASMRQPSGYGESSAIRINTGSWIARDRLRADVSVNYDANTGKFLEQRYVAAWTGSCYGIALEYRNYDVVLQQGVMRNQGNIGISITLKNVGTVPIS